MEWVNVKDRLPENEEVVWAFLEGRQETTKFYDNEILIYRYFHEGEFHRLDYSERELIEYGNIHWWMPYKEMILPPKE